MAWESVKAGFLNTAAMFPELWNDYQALSTLKETEGTSMVSNAVPPNSHLEVLNRKQGMSM